MPQTYQRIGEVVLGSNANQVTFNNIPQTYTDLIVDISAKSDLSTFGDAFSLWINNSSSSIVSTSVNVGDTSTILSNNSTIGLPYAQGYFAGNSSANWGNARVQIYNYTNASGSVGSIVSHGASSSGTFSNIFIRNSSFFTGANGVSRLDFYIIAAGGLILTGSSFRLYGVLRA